jgi:hypothetical protein
MPWIPKEPKINYTELKKVYFKRRKAEISTLSQVIMKKNGVRSGIVYGEFYSTKILFGYFIPFQSGINFYGLKFSCRLYL